MRKTFLAIASAAATLSICHASLEGSDEEMQVIFTPMKETFVDAFPYVEDGYESNATVIFRGKSPSPNPSEQESEAAVIYKSHTPNPFECEGWEDMGYVSQEEKRVELKTKLVIKEPHKGEPKKQKERTPSKPKSFFRDPTNIGLIVGAIAKVTIGIQKVLRRISCINPIL